MDGFVSFLSWKFMKGKGITAICVGQIGSDLFLTGSSHSQELTEPSKGARQFCAWASSQPSCVHNKSLIDLDVFREL